AALAHGPSPSRWTQLTNGGKSGEQVSDRRSKLRHEGWQKRFSQQQSRICAERHHARWIIWT
ncbi:MAG: hypothetical protein K2X00_18110, partial [Nitrospiraceae bacterium]|nr:hypothetical protein [Nitrospiraceae bacterium]